MKRFFVVFALLWVQLFAATPLQDRTLKPAALSELFAGMGIAPDKAIEQTQKEWLRTPGQERWQQTELSEEKRAFALAWGKKYGIFSTWEPSQTYYNKALILGATVPIMQSRLQHLKKLWEQGVRFSEIVWLTGERPLDQVADGPCEGCQNESEAAKLLWDRADDLPKLMRKLPVTFIALPMRVVDGVWKRPNTEDTIIAWGRMASSPCSCLFVSDQPFCGYQGAVIESALPEGFVFDIVGEGRDPSKHPAAAAITLDSVARWLYQQQHD